MKRPLLALTALVAAGWLFAAPATAALPVRVVPAGGAARLVVGGKLITLFRTPNGGLSAVQRAEKAAGRLEALIPQGLRPADIEIRSRGASWGVYARGGLLMVATPAEAEERDEEPKLTAQRWAVNLKAALKGNRPVRAAKVAPKDKAGAKKLAKAKPAPKKAVKSAAKPAKSALKPDAEPTLKVADTSVVVPFAETRTVSLLGTAAGEITVRSEDINTATVTAVPGRAAVEVRGVNPGSAVIHVSRGGKQATFTAWVKKLAGRVVEPATAGVTGTLTPGSLVRRAAMEHVLEGIQREPGTVVRVIGDPEGVRALARGATTQVEVPISITGEGYLPLKAIHRVQVRNVELPEQEAQVLLYSNDPESVKSLQTLYQGVVAKEGPVRLFYHHQNKTGRPFVFQIHLLNPNEAPAEVQIIEAEAGPFIDPIQVGHRAGAKYMEAIANEIGYISRIPAGGSRTVYTTTVPNELTVSGIYNFRVTSGGPLVAQVSAAAEAYRPAVSEGLLETAKKEPHTYPAPDKVEAHTYTVGERWTFIPMGRKAITGNTADRKLFGNYGVIYHLTVDLVNPTNEERTVQVLLTPDAGWARGAFLIDGKLVEAPQVAPPGEAVLYSVKLAPQESRSVKIQGVPVGGSFYPVSLVVRS